MRLKYLRAVLLLAGLSACGGGDDVTAPPAPPPPGVDSFTLTIAGSGAGSGRVATAPGVQPGLSCDLAGTVAPVGICLASYAEGTVVQLTVMPQENFLFEGWGGDAASCGTSTSCSITMSKNQTATVALASALSGVEVVSSTFFPQPNFGTEGAVIWAVEVRNVTSQLVASAEINFTSHDATGSVLASGTTFIGPIPPGESRVGQSFADYFGTEATAEFEVAEVEFASGASNLTEAEIVSSNWRADPDFALDGAVIWTVDVRNTTSRELELVQIEFSTYDGAGKIIAADFTFVGPIPPGETRSAESFADYHGTESSAKFRVASVE